MKKLLTTACLFVVTVVAIVSIIAPSVVGQDTKPAKVEPLFGKTVVTSQADGWRTIQFETTQVTAPDVAVTPDGEWLVIHQADDDREVAELGELEFFYKDI